MDLQASDNRPLNSSEDTPPQISQNPAPSSNQTIKSQGDQDHLALSVPKEQNPLDDSLLNVSKDVTLDPAMMGNMLVSGGADYSQLDKGCFAIYKIALLLAPTTMLVLSILKKNYLHVLQYIYLFIFAILEFIAIKERDLRKAAIVVLAFKIYLFIYPCVAIVVAILNRFEIEVILELMIQVMGFHVFLMFGALQVWNYLSKMQGQDEPETGSTDDAYLSSLCFLCFAMQ